VPSCLSIEDLDRRDRNFLHTFASAVLPNRRQHFFP
jgi:hypothetical protein